MSLFAAVAVVVVVFTSLSCCSLPRLLLMIDNRFDCLSMAALLSVLRSESFRLRGMNRENSGVVGLLVSAADMACVEGERSNVKQTCSLFLPPSSSWLHDSSLHKDPEHFALEPEITMHDTYVLLFSFVCTSIHVGAQQKGRVSE